MAKIQIKEQFAPRNYRVVTAETLRQEKMSQRLAREERIIESGAPKGASTSAQKAWYAERERRINKLQGGQIPQSVFPEGFDFRSVGSVLTDNKNHVFEAAVTQAQFGNAFSKRIDYEVDAGRDEVPSLYEQIYDVMIDANFPKTFEINTLQDVGVVMTEVKEGGEVQFASVGNGSKAITILRYAAGISYTDELFMYNQTWRMGPIEREFGKAVNALHNHIHLSPILTASYSASHQTAASTVGTTIYEKTSNTLDAAISAATKDQSNPRRGPYVLLCGLSDLTKIERALGRVPQEGFNLRPSTMDQIRTIVAYDGWSNTMGKKATSYDGVAANKAYLIHVGHREFDFQSKVKIPLRRQEQAGDLKRFIARDVIFDTHFGMYSAPTRAVQEITLPTS